MLYAQAKMSSNKDAAAPAACQQQQHRAPLMSVVPKPATSVDPFASVAPPAVPKPVAIMNTHLFGGPNTGSYQQQQLTHQMGISNANQVLGFQQQRPMVGTVMSASMGGTIAMQQRPGACGFYTGQHPAVSSGMGDVNYSNDITQLLNPASLATSHRNEPGKSIDIDAFARIGR